MRAAWETIRLLRAYYPESQVWVEGDALAVIQCLQASNTPQGCSLLLEDAKWILSELHVHQVFHTYREWNQCAEITKWVRECGSDVLLLGNFPFRLCCLTQADALGTRYERG